MVKTKKIKPEWTKCEACEILVPYIVKLDDSNTIYKICHTCLVLLVSVSLDNVRFKNLLKNGHSIKEFYLHEDFYDEDGNALQPNVDI